MTQYLCGIAGPSLCGGRPRDDDQQYTQELRAQFGEQLRAMETRTETQVALLAELYEFYKRRGDIEFEHAKQIVKMSRQLSHKARSTKERREPYKEHSMYEVWHELVEDSRQEAHSHQQLGEFYTTHVLQHIQQRQENLARLGRKCREVGMATHEEIARVLNELHTAMKTYHLFFAECSVIASKVAIAEQTKNKFEAANAKKVPNSRKYRQLVKDYNKRSIKFDEHRVRSLRARNEYLLCVDAANAALAQYFAADLPDLIDCGDVGQQHWLAHLMATVVRARKTLGANRMTALADLDGLQHNFDGALDRQRFMTANHSTFALPRRFEFKSHHADTVTSVQSHRHIQEELVQRLWQIQQRVNDLRAESDALYNSLTTIQTSIMGLQCEPSYDDVINNNTKSTVANLNKYATPTQSTPTTPTVGVTPMTPLGTPGGQEDKKKAKEVEEAEGLKRKTKLMELEDEYIQKFRSYVIKANLIRRLQARGHQLRHALDGRQPHVDVQFATEPTKIDSQRNGGVPVPHSPMANGVAASSTSTDVTQSSPVDNPPSLPTTVRRPIGAVVNGSASRRPKLFGGAIDEYTEATGDDIPLIVTSCVRMLSTFGLHHQGVFRVSGSQIEIQSFRDVFEQGDDPLNDPAVDTSFVNSVAGVLKLYLRQLRQPLFPSVMFTQFVDCAKLSDRDEFLAEIRRLVMLLPRGVVLVMRYLFAFLNHLSEFSDENMMDPYNLAICFGPTVMPIPHGNDQVFYHNYVAELVRNVITMHDAIFPANMPGTKYDKYTYGHRGMTLNQAHEETSNMCLSETTEMSISRHYAEEVSDGRQTTIDGTDEEEVGDVTTGEEGEEDNTSCTAVVDEVQSAAPVDIAFGTAYLQERRVAPMPEPLRSPALVRQTTQHTSDKRKIASEPPFDVENDLDHLAIDDRGNTPQIRSMHAQLSSPGQQLWMPYTSVTKGIVRTSSPLRQREESPPQESLTEMQSELKAVLSALEQFSLNRPTNGAPDLVQNLPSTTHRHTHSTSSSSHHVSPASLTDVRREEGEATQIMTAAARLNVQRRPVSFHNTVTPPARRNVIGPSPMPKPIMPWHRSTALNGNGEFSMNSSTTSSAYEERIV